MATIKKIVGLSDETGVTITANAAGSSTTLSCTGPKMPNCPYTPGSARFIKETGTTYRFCEHVNLGAGATEPTTYVADNN